MLVAIAALTGGCKSTDRLAEGATFGDSARGAILIAQTGCGSCHSIKGIRGADGQVGPPLNNIGARGFIAGVLPNTPRNMMLWIRSPQSVVPKNAMPDMGLSQRDSRDIAAYLYTLR
ncbi:MAG: c-type cytochrome [Candidatus Binataceae bacterium]|nr:c-type cytochrome [Candidatus Binataceae bacterium]